MEIKNKFNILEIVEDLFGNEYYISEIRICTDSSILYEVTDEKLGTRLLTQNEIKKSKQKSKQTMKKENPNKYINQEKCKQCHRFFDMTVGETKPAYYVCLYPDCPNYRLIQAPQCGIDNFVDSDKEMIDKYKNIKDESKN